MAKKFSELRDKMSPKSRAAADRKFKKLLAEMPLHELRNAQGLTQTQLAETLNVSQANVSKIERETDMYISTLRRFIKAIGGNLVIIAEMPHGNVPIEQFSRDYDEVKQSAT